MKDQFNSNISNITLRFHDAEQESSFQRYLVEKSLAWFKFALLSGAFFYLVYSIVDFTAYRSIASTLLYTRLILMIPVVGITLLIKPNEWYINNAMKLNMIAISLAGFGVLVITYIGRNELLINRNYVGVIMSFIYLYTFLRVSFVYCTLIGNALLLSAVAVEIIFVKAPFDILLSNVFFLVMANFICLFTCYLLEYQYRKEYFLKYRMERMSIEDSLTGLYNRHFFNSVVVNEMNALIDKLSSAGRRSDDLVKENDHFGILLLDIDFFKNVNDLYGHNQGDDVLIEFSTILRNNVRSDDYVIRWGGEEFMIVIPKTNSEFIKKFASRLGAAVEKYEFSVDPELKLTCSIGCITIPYCDELDLSKIIGLADNALYKSKGLGRNQGISLECFNKEIHEEHIIYN